jgi:predicted kinase
MSENLKLIAFSGLPATGKSRLAKHLTQALQIPMFSKDHFESILYKDQLSDGTSLSGYHLLLETAKLQVSLGLSVIIDAVFPLQGFRDSLKEIAIEHQAQLYIIHTYCSDKQLHQQYISERPKHIPWEAVDWHRVEEIRAFFVAWSSEEALFLDAVDSFQSNFERLLSFIGE